MIYFSIANLILSIGIVFWVNYRLKNANPKEYTDTELDKYDITQVENFERVWDKLNEITETVNILSSQGQEKEKLPKLFARN